MANWWVFNAKYFMVEPTHQMRRCQLIEPLYCEAMVLSILLLVNIRHASNKMCFVDCWSGRHGESVLVGFFFRSGKFTLVVFFVTSGKFSMVRVVFSCGLMVLGEQL